MLELALSNIYMYLDAITGAEEHHAVLQSAKLGPHRQRQTVLAAARYAGNTGIRLVLNGQVLRIAVQHYTVADLCRQRNRVTVRLNR